MWRVSQRDLLHRRRRFVLAVLATGLAFAMSLLMQGLVRHLAWESEHIVGLFGADSWVVAEGGTGPFTTMTLVPEEVATALRDQPGVRRADPFVQAREILDGRDTFVIGIVPGGLGQPDPSAGRAPSAAGEVMAASILGFRPGDTIELAGRPATVVGTVADATYYFGQPTVFAPIGDVQDRFLDGRRVVNGVAVSGTVGSPPGGTRLLGNDEAVADLDRPQASGRQSVVILDTLLGLMAAGIVATMVYLIALERTRDIAVLKAMGAGRGTLLGGVVLHGVVLAGAALLVGVVLAIALTPIMPFGIRIGWQSVARVGFVAVVVGLVAAFFGYRRSAKVDPALAFGRT